MDYKYLKSLIEKKTIKPVIVNPQSNFVVCTYWWGRGNLNQNTARPCMMYFEKLFIKIQNLCVEYLVRLPNNKNLYESVSRTQEYKKIIKNLAFDYSKMLFTDLKLDKKDDDNQTHKKAKEILYRRSYLKKKTPDGYVYKTTEDVENFLHLMAEEFILDSAPTFLQIATIYKQLQILKAKVEHMKVVPKSIIAETTAINKKLDIEYEKVKERVKMKRELFLVKAFAGFNNVSFYDILQKELRYTAPIKYDEMIINWEKACEKANCNYMAVEYPQFAEKGGYQLAINAKPLFIKKALDSVGKRAVLYIDGDMLIQKYPSIFDLKDIDFMGRGWNIDPRASDIVDESVYFDPYTFEVSGGTMWFSQTNLSKKLLTIWIEESGKKENIGKADDRILSLLFNTNKLLLPMKIIQLPIEYLWLSLDYDYFLPDLFYNGSKKGIEKNLYIEHPECLTSEDTAASSGASSDRTPVNYNYVREISEPVSEQYHAYMNFPTSSATRAFKPYLEYMSNAQYINDGSPKFIEKEFVDPKNPENNEQMLYVTYYKNRFGKNKYFLDKSITWNKVGQIMLNHAKNLNLNTLHLNKKKDLVEIQDFMQFQTPDKSGIDAQKLLACILRLLMKNKKVLYNPKELPGYNKANYKALMNLEKSTKGEMEFLFVPNFKNRSASMNNLIYKPQIQLNQPMLFKPSEILIKFLTMFLSLNDLSEYLNYGSYEFISRIRIGYVFNKTKVGGSLLNEGIDLLFDKTTANKTRKHQLNKNKYTRKIHK